MMLLAIVLAGKGAHSLQEAGLIPVTTFPLALRWDLVGLFPSYQTLLVQVGVVLVFFILFYNDKKTSH
jgi:high-affinity iron transporter